MNNIYHRRPIFISQATDDGWYNDFIISHLLAQDSTLYLQGIDLQLVQASTKYLHGIDLQLVQASAKYVSTRD